jgi:hypothetical protein
VFNNYTSYPIISCTLNFYDGDYTKAFLGEDYGVIGSYGAQVRSETLIITDNIITAAYGTATPQSFVNSPNWNTGYPLAFSGTLQNYDVRLGYLDRRSGWPDYEPGWYLESSRAKYDFQEYPALPISEQVGRVFESRDVFDAWQKTEYDIYLLMPVKSTQYLDLYPTTTNKLETEAFYDYRVMQPYKVKDPNLNCSVFDFSALGLLRATALIGKSPATLEGDYKGGPGTGYYDLYVPSVMMEYNFFAFMDTQDPVWVKTISRELHYQQSVSSDTITKVEYSDGFGRLLQTRVQAEDVIFGNQSIGTAGLPEQQGQNGDAIGIERTGGAPLNVVVSGWKIYNNKGKVVEQYEPFFDSGFDYTELT